MDLVSEIIESLKQIGGSAVSVGATILINNNGIPIIFNYLGGVPEANVALQGLAIVVSYGIWKQAVIPIVENLFAKIMPKTTQAKGKIKKDYFALV